ncbi:MAG: S1C family serine protease, partial [Planctomycetota bacterium]
MSQFRITLIFLLGLSVVTVNPVMVRGEELNLAELQKDVWEMIDEVRPAVVNIFGGGTSFSGVIVSPEGHVLSVAHAVRPGTRYRVMLPDGRRLRGVGKGANGGNDSAVIKITDVEGELPYVPMGDSSSLVRNQPCVGLSYPGGQKASGEPVVRFGRIVSGTRGRGYLQSTALMEPGDSGGPLFDLNGYVIGIHSRIGRVMDRNYEVPVDAYRKYWNELNREQTFERSGPPMPRLGIRCTVVQTQNDEGERSQLEVIGVVDGARASKGGMERGDMLLRVYDRDMEMLDDLRNALIAARDEGAETLSVEVQRGDEVVEL